MKVDLKHLSTRTAVLLGLLGGLTGVAMAAENPNVVVIIADDAGWADFGFMDSITGQTTELATPNLDALAARGVSFSSAYTASLCSASRAMITTGMYGGRFGFYSNSSNNSATIDPNGLIDGLAPDQTTLFDRMQSENYTTGVVGKWHLGAHADQTSGSTVVNEGNRPEPQGIDEFRGIWAGKRDYFAGTETGTDLLRETTVDSMGNVTDTVVETARSGEYVTDIFGEWSADFIADHYDDADPFFLYTSFTAPHNPIDLSNVKADDYNNPIISGISNDNRRLLAANMLAMDRAVGDIVEKLEDPDGNPTTDDSIYDNTLIIFINDNGGDCCDSNGTTNYASNADLREGKGTQWEGGMRVPMFIAGGLVNPSVQGTTFDAPVHSVDIVATAVTAAGGSFAPEEKIDGVDLLPYVNGVNTADPHDAVVINRYSNHRAGIRMGEWKLMHQDGTFQLYNMDNDRGESNNVAAENPAIVAQLQQRLTSYDVEFDKPRYDIHNTKTNQFDHFRFREDSFTTATWSQEDAWIDGDGGTGNATMTFRDTYANNELTFRTKANGDYTASNDMTRYSGLAYMANRMNLSSGSSPVAQEGTGTISALPVIFVNSLEGTAPKIALDAIAATPGQFTFDVALDVEVYDDLEIGGDGNQKFVFSGDIREYRVGRSIFKTGTADVTFGGALDVSGTVDLDGGKVSFIDGTVGGDLVARSGVTVNVGGTGFNKVISTPPNLAPIVTTGLDLHYNAALDFAGDAAWDDVAGTANDLSFGSGATSVTVSDSTFLGITSAYSIPLTGQAIGLYDYFEGSSERSREDATFEVWFKVDNTSAGSNQVIFEVGAGRGVALTLDNDTVKFNVDGDGSTLTISQPIGTGWHQAVGIIDLVGNNDDLANDSMTMYVDNTFVGTLTNVLIDDWAGSNEAGIGGAECCTVAGGSPIDYHGQIAVARYYRDYVFDVPDVDLNYQSALTDAGVSQILLPTTLTVAGDYTQNTATTLQIDLLDTSNFDSVAVTGTAVLAGTLEVAGLVGFATSLGDQYQVLTAANIIGAFDDLLLPTPDTDQMWVIQYESTSVSLLVTVAGDFDGDGDVDGQDLAKWEGDFGGMGSDADGDGDSDGVDFLLWQQHFASGAATSLAVPEPATLLLLISGLLGTVRFPLVRR